MHGNENYCEKNLICRKPDTMSPAKYCTWGWGEAEEARRTIAPQTRNRGTHSKLRRFELEAKGQIYNIKVPDFFTDELMASILEEFVVSS
jgi:hypothetical protein